jgi:hypothetical protein
MKRLLLTSSGVACLFVAIYISPTNNDSKISNQKTSTPAPIPASVKKTPDSTGPVTIEIPLRAGFAEDK